MRKLKLISVFSLVILALLLIYNSWSVFPGDDTLARSSGQRHLDGEIFFSFDFQNMEGKDLDYTYLFYLNDELLQSKTLHVAAEKGFGYETSFNPAQDGVTKYRLVVYREGDAEPVTDITRYILPASEDEKWRRKEYLG